MTTEFSNHSPTTMTASDDQIVNDLMSELATVPPTQRDPEFLLHQQRQLAWEHDRARIEDFFNRPSDYLQAYWQEYKPLIMSLVLLALAIVTLQFIFSIIGFIVGIPLLSPLFELIGFGYSIWFTQRYLLKAKNRQELWQQVDQIKQKIIGTTEDVVGDTSLIAKKSITIQKSPEELYRFWRDFENLPRFMNHLQSVTVLDDKRSHWVAKAPLDTTVEWDAEIIDEKENKSIVWKSLEGAEVESVGSVAFTSANGSGTNVKVTMKYNPPAGVLGATAAALFGENPQQQLDEDLKHLKQVLEANH